jgi:tetratricopeptide (TPR) repeat protein
LKRRPTDELSWVAHGLALLARAPLEALGDFDEALKQNTASIPALEAKAHVLSERLGRTEDAIAVLDTAVQLHPDYAPLRSGRGVLRARLGRRDEAIRDALESLHLDRGAEVAYQVAGIYALTSRANAEDRDEALRLLALALADGYGFELLDRDPDLEPLRSLPAFRKTVEAAQRNRGEAIATPN